MNGSFEEIRRVAVVAVAVWLHLAGCREPFDCRDSAVCVADVKPDARAADGGGLDYSKMERELTDEGAVSSDGGDAAPQQTLGDSASGAGRGDEGGLEDAGHGQSSPPAHESIADVSSDERPTQPMDAGPDLSNGADSTSSHSRPAQDAGPAAGEEREGDPTAEADPAPMEQIAVADESDSELLPQCQENHGCAQGVCRQGICQAPGLFSEECDEWDGDLDCSEGLTCFSGACLKPLGRVCSAATECASEVCECADNGCSFQRCSALPCLECQFVSDDGAACAGQMNGVSAPGCDGGLACVAGQCVQPCTENDDCTDPETCRQGICSALGRYGEVCDPEDSVSETDARGEVVETADDDCSWAEGVTCDSEHGVCRLGFEVECTQERQCITDLACGHDDVCRWDNNTEATCVVVAQEALCASGYCGYRFLPPFTGIWLGRCATPRQLGESCDDVELDCIEGECVSGTCELP